MRWYLHDEDDRLLCEECWIGRSGDDPELESLLCLHDDWQWTAYEEAKIDPAADRPCDWCGRTRPSSPPRPQTPAGLVETV